MSALPLRQTVETLHQQRRQEAHPSCGPDCPEDLALTDLLLGDRAVADLPAARSVLVDRVLACAGCAQRFRQLMALHDHAAHPVPRHDAASTGRVVPFPRSVEPPVVERLAEETLADATLTDDTVEPAPTRRRRVGVWAGMVAAAVLVLMLWPRGPERAPTVGVERIGSLAALRSEVGPWRSQATDKVQPEEGQRLVVPPRALRWPAETGARRYRPILLGAGEERWQGPWVTTPGWRFPPSVVEAFRPGTYAWSVEVEGDVARRTLGPFAFELYALRRAQTRLPGHGVLVTHVAADSLADRADLRVGDRLLAWRGVAEPEACARPLAGPLDMVRLLREEARRQTVVVQLRRQGVDLERTVEAGRWRLDVGAGESGAHPLWDAVVEAREVKQQGRFDDAVATLEAALASAHDAPPHALYTVAAELGEVETTAERFDRAAAAFRRAAVLGQLGDTPTLTRAAHHTDLGVVAHAAGDLETAEAEHLEALAIRRALAPGSPEVAVSLNNLGVVAHYRGDPDRAEALWLEAAELFGRSAPDALASARLLVNLGAAAFSRGDLDRAETRWRRAHALRLEHRPDSLDLAATHNNLGLVLAERGAVEAAETHHRQALALRRRLAPESLAMARSLHNLSTLLARRGDRAASAGLERQAATLRQRIAPDHLETAQSWLSLGRLDLTEGRVEAARQALQTGLDILTRTQPEGGLDTALGWLALGRLEAQAGDTEAARDALSTALELLSREAPGSLFEARARRAWVRLALGSGEEELNGLRDHLTLAEAIVRRLAPDSAALAETLGLRADLARSEGDLETARTLGLEALEVLDRQERHWGGTEVDRMGFGERFGDLYFNVARDFLARDFLADATHTADLTQAWTVVERYRARRVRAWLASRPNRSGSSQEQTTTDRVRLQIRALEQESATIRRRLETLDANASTTEVDTQLVRLRELRVQREALARSLQAALPQPPAPLPVSEVASTLAPGSLLVSFLVSDAGSLVLGLDGTGRLAGAVLDTDRASLTEQVATFRQRVTTPELGPSGLLALAEQGQQLYDRLLAPLAGHVAAANRLVIVPDGPLDDVPWAALVVGGSSEDPRYLVDAWPVSVALSGSVEGSVGARQPVDPQRPWVVLAPAEAGSVALPGSRWEAEQVQQWVGGAVVRLGDAASEATLRALAPEAGVLHLAAHGVLDTRLPFDSHLVLATSSAADSGDRLYAWEVMEELDLDASLVTLSACESRGRSAGGSGPLGLVTAFHLAGARSVLASHWRVADRPTAVLMDRLAEGLAAGLPKDEALRQAQRALREAPILLPPREDRSVSLWERLGRSLGWSEAPTGTQFDARHPAYWAAFQLSGDGASGVGRAGTP